MEASATRMLWSMSVLPTERPLRKEGFELKSVTGKKDKSGLSLELPHPSLTQDEIRCFLLSHLDFSGESQGASQGPGCFSELCTG